MCGANSGPKSWFDVLSSSNLFNPFFPLELILWKPRKCLPHLWPIEIKQITQNRQKLLSNHVSKVYFQRERESAMFSRAMRSVNSYCSGFSEVQFISVRFPSVGILEFRVTRNSVNFPVFLTSRDRNHIGK